MTFPVEIHIFGNIIPVHPVFELLAFFIAYRYFQYLRRNKKSDLLSPEAEWWIIIGMAAGAFLGSRLISALENPYLFLHPPGWAYYIASQTVAGGIAGGIIGVEITKKILNVRRKTGDLFVYPIILGMIIGRIGCFLTGVNDGTVGLPSNLPWTFDQGDGILRHPTSLYEILFLGLLWIIIKRTEKLRILKEGDLFYIFVLFYSLFRFLEEYIKPREMLALDLSSIQITTGLLVLYCIVYFIRRYNIFNKWLRLK